MGYLLFNININSILSHTGDVAQMVERSLSMREERGSIPRISIFFRSFSFLKLSGGPVAHIILG